MTEDQAKTKWCPYARIPVPITDALDRMTGTTVVNRNIEGEAYGFCLGANCMAWREDRKGLGVMGGYCGLAGRPE